MANAFYESGVDPQRRHRGQLLETKQIVRNDRALEVSPRGFGCRVAPMKERTVEVRGCRGKASHTAVLPRRQAQRPSRQVSF